MLALLVPLLFYRAYIWQQCGNRGRRGFAIEAQLTLLGALFLLALAFSPLAIAASLRIIWE